MGKQANFKRFFFVAVLLIFFIFFISFVFSSTVVRDANNNLTFFGYSLSTVNSPPPPPNTLSIGVPTPLTITNQNSIKSRDADWLQTTVGDNLEGYLLLNASLGSGNIQNITWNWNGYFYENAPATSTLYFYMWNFTSSSWFECASNLTQGSSDVNRTCSATSDVANFYDSSRQIYFMAYGTDVDDIDTFQNIIYTNYVDAEINSFQTLLIYPPNNTFSNKRTNSFICNSSGADLVNMTLYLWNSTKIQGTNMTNVTGSYNQTNMSYTFAYDDTFIWNCRAQTSSGNFLFFDNNYTFTVDTIYPNISILSPLNNSNTTNSQINVNYTTSDARIGSCWWNNGGSNGSINCGTNISGVTWNEGINNVTIFVNDTVGNTNSSTVTFRLDTISPIINIYKPIPSEEFSSNFSVPLNFSSIDSGVGTQSCWYNLDLTTNLSIPCSNITFNTTDGAHIIYLYSNDNLNNLASATRGFTISLSAPAITLDSPLNDTYWNNGTNFKLNYTATDSNGISVCQIWHNLDGTFKLNRTTIPTTAKMNYTSYNITDGYYYWNSWCNDTLGNGRFSANNHTFTIDTIFPTIAIDTIRTVAGSVIVLFNSSYNELNCNNSFFSVYNSSNGIDSLSVTNKSLTCSNMNNSFSVSDWGDYRLQVYLRDKAGNENSKNLNFTVSQISGGIIGGGGGGGGGESEKIPVVGLQDVNSSTSYISLDLEMIYARINDFCSDKSETTLAIKDYSDSCSLTLNDLEKIRLNLINQGLSVPNEDLIKFFKNYKSQLLFQGYESSDTIEKFKLFTSVLGITNPMKINPSSLDKFFLINSNGGSKNISYSFSVNKNIKECTVTGGTDLFCITTSETTFEVIQYVNNTNFLNKIFTGDVTITSKSSDKNIEVRVVPITMRVYNIQGNLFGIPAYIFLIGIVLIIFIFAFLIFGNKKLRKQLNGNN